MSSINLSQIECYLTDRYGNILDPYTPGSISYSDVTRFLKTGSQRVRMPSGKYVRMYQFVVYIQGYLSLFMEGNRISLPIPFRVYKSFYLDVPRRTVLSFKTCLFKCNIHSINTTNDSLNINIHVRMNTTAYPKNQQNNVGCLRFFTTEINITYKYKENLLKAEVYQYNALSDGDKNTYYDTDELTEYGNKGILDPETVSFFSLYINGVVQPGVNYEIKEGDLRLKTNVPIENAPILIRFVTFKDTNGEVLPAEIYYYYAISDGEKTEYRNGDAIYSDKGILDPEEVSFINLYINGVLQPSVNYTVEENLLALLTSDIPPNEVPIVLEFITIKRLNGQVIKAKTYTFNALAHENNIYTNEDELTIYGNQGILDPTNTSYNNLFINAVLQPSVNYSVQKGLLTLNTDNLPLKDSPIALQFVTITS